MRQILGTCIAALFAGCGAQPGARNLVLISIDTLRADHVGAYGYGRPTTPRLDALAREATLYGDAVASSPWTLPSHASMFTGLPPSLHGAYGTEKLEGMARNAYPLDDAHTTLAEVLQGAGFQTGAFVANGGYLAVSLNLDQGFDVYRVKREPAEVQNRSVFAWIDALDDRPFFLFVNYMDTHRPYNTQPLPGFPFDPVDRDPKLIDRLIRAVMVDGAADTDELRRLAIDQYDLAVANADAAVGALFDRLREAGHWDDTAVVVTSDHGEYFGEHGLVEHGKDVYEAVLRVPLLVKRAGQRRAERVERRTLSADLPALVASAMEPGAADALRRALPGAQSPPLAEIHYGPTMDRLAHGSRFHRVRRAIYAGRYKYIGSSDGADELYDLAADPGESDNRIAAEPDVARRLAARLRAVGSVRDASPAPPALAVPPEELEALRELGYADR